MVRIIIEGRNVGDDFSFFTKIYKYNLTFKMMRDRILLISFIGLLSCYFQVGRKFPEINKDG